MPRLTTSALLTTALFMSGAASADSFAINEYSASDLGRANSGRTTQTIDPAASFGNPALMTEFETSQASLALASILGDATFNDDGSVDVLGAPLGNGSSGILDDAIVPAAHAIFVLNDRWRLGVSVNAPFGLSTSYDDDWAGRYQALESELKTININPSVAYRVTSTFSIGAGLSAQYADARLTSAVDFGATCFSQLGPMTCASLGLTPQAADGRAIAEGDDWSYGWNAGLLWRPIPTGLSAFITGQVSIMSCPVPLGSMCRHKPCL